MFRSIGGRDEERFPNDTPFEYVSFPAATPVESEHTARHDYAEWR
jgi:hypothetical protein